MKEETLSLFDVIGEKCAICITTHGDLRTNGDGMMGAGLAKAAAIRFPSIERCLGHHLRMRGNVPGLLGSTDEKGLLPLNGSGRTLVLSFPTKNSWRQPSSLELIENSAKLLVQLVDAIQLPMEGPLRVYLPRPGCGLGGLIWADVRAKISPILDDRFIVVNQS